MSEPRESPAACWCFTLYFEEKNHNYDDDPLCWYEKFENITYLIRQLEQCPKTGKLHYQGFLQVHPKKRLSWFKENVHESCHFEAKRFPGEGAKTYCEKSETRCEGAEGPVEVGNCTSMGKSLGLMVYKGRIDKGESFERVRNDDDLFSTGIIHGKSLRDYEQTRHLGVEEAATKRTWYTDCVVLVGRGRVGKTTFIQNHAVGRVYTLPYVDGKPWWQNYKGEENVVINEFEGQIDNKYMRLLLDKGPMYIEWKGGGTELLAHRIWITSNKEAKDWWPRRGLRTVKHRLVYPFGQYFRVKENLWEKSLRVKDYDTMEKARVALDAEKAALELVAIAEQNFQSSPVGSDDDEAFGERQSPPVLAGCDPGYVPVNQNGYFAQQGRSYNNNNGVKRKTEEQMAYDEEPVRDQVECESQRAPEERPFVFSLSAERIRKKRLKETSYDLGLSIFQPAD